MNTSLKLTTLLFAMVAFLAVTCGQPREDTKGHNPGKVHDHDEAEHHVHGNDNGEMAAYGSINDEQASGILDAYLALKDALVKSSTDVAQNAAEEIKNILSGNTESKVLKDLLEDANHIINTDEIGRIRKHFDLMSQNVYGMVKVKNTGKTIYKQFCPMAFENEGAFWLSAEEEIRNPYFGDKMLKCGKVQETVDKN